MDQGPATLKQCTQCKQWKSRDQFNKRAAKADGLQSECRDCHNLRCRKYREEHPDKIIESRKKTVEKNREKLNQRAREYVAKNRAKIRERNKRRRQENLDAYRAREREYYAQNKDKIRARFLKSTYGITMLQYDALLASQNYCCACCGAGEPRGTGNFNVDHDHETGQIRGIVCQNCNAGIGQLGDTLDGVKKAIAYLETSPQNVKRVLSDDLVSNEDAENLCD